MAPEAVLARVRDLAALQAEQQRSALESKREQEEQARRTAAREAVAHDLGYWLHKIEKAAASPTWEVTNASLRPRHFDRHYMDELAGVLGPLFVVRECHRGLPSHRCVEVVLAETH